MKLNLGSGYSRYDGFLNVDNDISCEPDYLVDLESDLPFEDNSVDEIILNHVLEHIGFGFFKLMQEIYRISRNDCKIHIRVPYHRHDNFLNDPTHVRVISVEVMKLFSKKHNQWSLENNDSSSKLAFRYGVDFEVIDYGFVYDPMFAAELQSMSETEVNRLCRLNNNVLMETVIEMLAVK